MSIGSICVFCGSRPGRQGVYGEAAEKLGRALAMRDIKLVYGGSGVGLMGTIADAVLKEGGRVLGVIPEALVEREVAHHHVTDLRIVRNMHERKSLMYESADGFIAMPGGIGTLEEFFEVYTWKALGDHQKPLGLLNVAGYYDPLVRLLDHITEEGFVDEAVRRMVRVSDDPDQLLEMLEEEREK